jgi:large subunit ribosomal protein L32
MGLPGHRRTSGDKRRRRTHAGLAAVNAGKCPKCTKPVLSHRACEFCGTYRGRQVITLRKSKKVKK